MLAVVAQNYASPFFEMRVYTTDDNDDLREFSFSRNSGGWAPGPNSVSETVPEVLSTAGTAPLLAVAAIIIEGEWKTKFYFYPQCPIVAEWDVCAKMPGYAGITQGERGRGKEAQYRGEDKGQDRGGRGA
jgi:hypothetical protein